MFNYKVVVLDNYSYLIKSPKKIIINNTCNIVYDGLVSKDTEKVRSLSNLRRSRRMIKELIKLNLSGSDVMLTLTYKENYTDYTKSNYHLKNFLKKIGSPNYLAVKELQERGAIHYHLILFDYVSKKDCLNAWTWGFIFHKDIIDLNAESLGNYLGKYLTDYEKGQLIENNKNMYSCSRSLKRYKRYDGDLKDYLYFSKGLKIVKNGYTKYILPNA